MFPPHREMSVQWPSYGYRERRISFSNNIFLKIFFFFFFFLRTVTSDPPTPSLIPLLILITEFSKEKKRPREERKGVYESTRSRRPRDCLHLFSRLNSTNNREAHVSESIYSRTESTPSTRRAHKSLLRAGRAPEDRKSRSTHEGR